MNLSKEININKKLIVAMLLINVIVLVSYFSYAYFQVSVIQDNVVVIQTGTINISTAIIGSSSPTVEIAEGETKEVSVTLFNDLNREVNYKMYYTSLSDMSKLEISSPEIFENNIVEGTMNTTKTIAFTFINNGTEPVKLTFGTQGGLAGYPIVLSQGEPLVLSNSNN